jgi:antitoxin HicB
MAKANRHRGSSFDAFLVEDNLYEEVNAKALKRAIAEQLLDQMERAKLTKSEMALRMETSRAQLDRVLDPNATSIQLDSLVRAARALGKDVEIRLKRSATVSG